MRANFPKFIKCLDGETHSNVSSSVTFLTINSINLKKEKVTEGVWKR